MKLLDQGTLKSMVVNSEDVLNLTAGRSYSAGGHNLHFSTRILKHVRILTPDTNSEARANSDIWHEFWSTREFWHHFTSSCSLMFGTRKFWHQNRWHKYFHFFPIPTQASPKEWPPLYYKREYYGMYMFVINWMNKLLRHEQEQALLHNIIEVEVINFIFKFSILTLLDDQ